MRKGLTTILIALKNKIENQITILRTADGIPFQQDEF